MADSEYAGYVALLANAPVHAEPLQHISVKAATGIGLYMN